MAGEYDVGPWVEHEPGRWWQAHIARGEMAGDLAAQVIVATDGQGYDWTAVGGSADIGSWRHDPRDARNAALAALRAEGLTTPPDEPEPASATEAPTAPSEPDEGAASPAGPGEAARAAAESALDYRRDQSGDGWPEDTAQIAWGRVMGRAVERVLHEHDADCRNAGGEWACPEGVSEEFDYVAAYDLREVRRG